MGCSSSSGGSGPSKKGNAIKSLKFKDTGVHSVDDFLHKVKKCVQEFGDLLEPLEEAAYKFADVTGFWRDRKASKLSRSLNIYHSLETLNHWYAPLNRFMRQCKFYQL